MAGVAQRGSVASDMRGFSAPVGPLPHHFPSSDYDKRYTGREIQAVTADRIGEVRIKQGVIARLLGIGTVMVCSASAEQVLRLRGIKDAEVIKSRIEASSSGHPS